MLGQPPAQVQAAGAAEPDIAQHDVRSQRGDDRQGLFGAARLADYPHAPGETRQHGLQPLHDHLMIVDQDDAHGPALHD